MQIYEDRAFDMSIGIQVNNNKTYYYNIPILNIDDMSLSELRQYKMYGAKTMKKYSQMKKTSDFGGDFQNVNDVRPDPGNVNPGRNREYLKQQEDFYPRKTSGDDDNGEFVHTHPEHCPRPDLRKLKIVEDGEEVEHD